MQVQQAVGTELLAAATAGCTAAAAGGAADRGSGSRVRPAQCRQLVKSIGVGCFPYCSFSFGFSTRESGLWAPHITTIGSCNQVESSTSIATEPRNPYLS